MLLIHTLTLLWHYSDATHTMKLKQFSPLPLRSNVPRYAFFSTLNFHLTQRTGSFLYWRDLIMPSRGRVNYVGVSRVERRRNNYSTTGTACSIFSKMCIASSIKVYTKCPIKVVPRKILYLCYAKCLFNFLKCISNHCSTAAAHKMRAFFHVVVGHDLWDTTM
jgi:hypothetical protein